MGLWFRQQMSTHTYHGKIRPCEVNNRGKMSEILFGSICEALLSLFIPVSFAFINFIGVPFMANKK
jgi:hypothetical protein